MPTNVILVRFDIEQAYHLVGFYHHELSESNLNLLRRREKASQNEEVMLNAKFFILDEASYRDFAAHAYPNKLGWHNKTAWGEVANPNPTTQDDSITEAFEVIIDNGLSLLEKRAHLLTLEQNLSWDGVMFIEGFYLEDEDGDHEHGCCAFYDEQ